jgi:hypothetical protein
MAAYFASDQAVMKLLAASGKIDGLFSIFQW